MMDFRNSSLPWVKIDVETLTDRQKNNFITIFFQQIHKMNEPDSYLRVIVEGGGCSGFQYLFELDTKVNEDDRYGNHDSY